MWKLIGSLSLTLCMIASAEEAEPKPSVSVDFCGRMRHGVMTIGAECTGTTISFDRVIWELQLQNEAQRKFAKEHHKETIVATGKLRRVSGIETRDRWIIDVEKISTRDATKDQPGVKMTILGMLQMPNPKDSKVASASIKADGQTWTIDLSSQINLEANAVSLSGQPVLLAGMLKPVTSQKTKEQPVIRVSTLKLPPTAPAAKSNERR